MIFVFWIVFSLCVIVIVVFFLVVLFKVVCIMCLDLELSVEVVLLRSKILGLWIKVWVIVICCFWLLLSRVFLELIIVLNLLGSERIKL